MENRTLRIFNLVCIENKFFDKELYMWNMKSSSLPLKNVLFVASGKHTIFKPDGSILFSYLGPNLFWLNDHAETILGNHEVFVEGEAVTYCFDQDLNKNFDLNNIKLLTLNSNDEIAVDLGKKLFLATGNVVIDNEVINAPAKIKFSKSTTMKANANSCGIFIL